MDDKKLPLMEHLSDMRQVLVRASYGFILGVVIAYILVEHFLRWLKLPILKMLPANSKLVVLSPAEYFFCELKVAAVFGFVIASPWILTQVWKFIAPGLYKNEKYFFWGLISSASLSFIGGSLFARYVIFEPMFRFFINTLPDDVTGNYSVGTLIGFSLMTLFAFGLVFQTPLVVFLSIYSGLIDASSLKAYRKHIFVSSFIIGAILTPPDPLTQVMLALPCYLLFELGLWIAVFLAKKRETISTKSNNLAI